MLAALKTSAYSLPLNVPSCGHAGAKFVAIADFAYVIGFSLPCFDELLDVARLRDVGHVRRMAAGDRGREHGRDVVADRLVVDLDLRVDLVEGLDHVAELLLPGRRGPDPVERDRARDAPRRASAPSCSLLRAPAATSCRRDGERRRQAGERNALATHARSFRRCCRRRSRSLSPGRRSGGRACRPRPRRARPRATRERAPKRPTIVVVSDAAPRGCCTVGLADVLGELAHLVSVTACFASTAKCTMISEPSASRSSTLPRSRLSAGVVGRERGVLEVLGPDAEDHGLARVAREAPGALRASRRRARPSASPSFGDERRRSARSSVASSMFIAGLPMKPPTNRLTGRS